MKQILALALCASLLLNAFLLLQRHREAPAIPPVPRAQIVPPVAPDPVPSPAPTVVLPRPGMTLPDPAPRPTPLKKPAVTLVASPTYATFNAEIQVSVSVLSG